MRTIRMTAVVIAACACSSGAPEGTAKRLAECSALPHRDEYYCNKRLYDEVQALKKAEAAKSEESSR